MGFWGAVFFSDVKMGFHIHENPYYNYCNHSLEEEHTDLGMLQFPVVSKNKNSPATVLENSSICRYLVEFIGYLTLTLKI